MKTFTNTGSSDSFDIVHMKWDKDKYTIKEIGGNLIYESSSLDRQYIVSNIEEIGFKHSNGISNRFKFSNELKTYGVKLSCKDILDRGDSNGDGVYTINPTKIDGEEFDVYRDMTTDGGGWTLVHWHDASNGDFYGNVSNALNYNEDYVAAPDNGPTMYSILNRLNSLKSNASYEFNMLWPEYNKSNQWKQTFNPLSSGSPTRPVAGYEAINIQS